MKKYQEQLDKAYNEYIQKIEGVAAQARKDYLIPYLKKNGYNFLSGNGTYYIFNPTNRDNYIMLNLPKRIEKILQLEVGDRGNSELGLWMLDYEDNE